MIRHFKPRRIVEIGAGNSTLLARKAIAKNAEGAPSYTCDHVCIEPYEAPWLEKTGARIVRTRVEECPFELFENLGQNDILFIDSSHVIRPQGDVVHEYLHIFGPYYLIYIAKDAGALR
jgi:transposase